MAATPKPRTSANYVGLAPASAAATNAAKGASKKRDTKPEVLLRRALWARGLRYRVDVAALPGRPDIVLAKHRLVVFCDGDFWHGRNLEARLAKLEGGHNAAYWVKKISRNAERDRAHDAQLRAAGWRVLRLWEGEILRDVEGAATRVLDAATPSDRRPASPLRPPAEPLLEATAEASNGGERRGGMQWRHTT